MSDTQNIWKLVEDYRDERQSGTCCSNWGTQRCLISFRLYCTHYESGVGLVYYWHHEYYE